MVAEEHTGSRLGQRRATHAAPPSHRYAGVFDKIHAVITDTFGLGDLWFTAPTFITRLIGNPEWQPAARHHPSPVGVASPSLTRCHLLTGHARRVLDEARGQA